MTIHEKIQLLRKKNGWTQEELADKLDISRQALSKWELGTAIPDTVNVLKISKLFSVPTDYLLDDTYNTPEEFEYKSGTEKILESANLTNRAKQLINERGYMAGYILAGGSFIGLMVVSFICYAYLSVLMNIAPLAEFPPQAFILPIIAAIVGVFIITKIIFFLLLSRKLKRLAKRPTNG